MPKPACSFSTKPSPSGASPGQKVSKESQRQAFLFCLMFRHKQNVDVSVIWPSNLILASVAFPAQLCVQLKCQCLPALDFPHTGETGGTRRLERRADFSHPKPFDNLHAQTRCPSSEPMAAPIRLSISAPFPRRTCWCWQILTVRNHTLSATPAFNPCARCKPALHDASQPRVDSGTTTPVPGDPDQSRSGLSRLSWLHWGIHRPTLVHQLRHTGLFLWSSCRPPPVKRHRANR